MLPFVSTNTLTNYFSVNGNKKVYVCFSRNILILLFWLFLSQQWIKDINYTSLSVFFLLENCSFSSL